MLARRERRSWHGAWREGVLAQVEDDPEYQRSRAKLREPWNGAATGDSVTDP